MAHPTTAEAWSGTDFTSSMTPLETLHKPFQSILKTRSTFTTEVAATETWVNLNIQYKISTKPSNMTIRTQSFTQIVDL